MFSLFCLEKTSGTLGVVFTVGNVCKDFALFCCGYLGGAPISYVQDTIFNLPHPCTRGTCTCTTVLLDTE